MTSFDSVHGCYSEVRFWGYRTPEAHTMEPERAGQIPSLPQTYTIADTNQHEPLRVKEVSRRGAGVWPLIYPRRDSVELAVVSRGASFAEYYVAILVA